MRKIFTLFALMAMFVSGVVSVNAQTYSTATGTNTLNAASIKSKADAGTLYVSIMNHTTSSDKYINKTGYMTSTFGENTVWQVVSYNGGYALKNLDGNYINNATRPMTVGSDITSATLFMPTDCEAGVSNIAAGYNSSYAVRWKLKDNTSNQMNTNGASSTTTVMFNNGTGNWTCLFTYEVTVSYNVTFNYVDESNNSLGSQTVAYADGTTIDDVASVVPTLTGYNIASVNPTSLTINGADATVDVVCSNAATNNIVYRVVDENNNVLFTSPAATVNTGTTITTLPSEYQQTLFYDYNTVNVTVTADQNIDFVATVKSSAPFTPSASAASPVWHSLTLSATPNYVTYSASSAQNVTLPTSNADDATTLWAFIGSPYDGFTIVNKAAGTSLVLGSDVTTGSSNTGGNVYATLAAAGSQTNEVWTVVTSSYRTNGFYLQNTEGHRLNKRNGTSNVSYWTGGSDAGSTFVAVKALTLAELIVQANALKTTLTDGANTVAIGYPTAAALATFGDAIDAAQDVVDNAGDEDAGMNTLKAAMTAVQSVANTNYTPRTDVYYTITSGRGSMIYDASHSGQTDATYGNEFLWYTTSLDATNANHQWGFIEKDGAYYMYNVGKMQFANVTQGGSYQGSNGDKHSWMFSDAPSSVILDGGEGGWVATPNVRVRATSEVTGKQYAMSISTSYVGPVIAYDAVSDGGIPMTFAVATTTQDATVTAAIEALLEDLTPYRDALQQAINDVTSLPTGVGLNQYTITSGAEDLANALVAAQTELGKDAADQTKESLNTARTNLETAVSALVMTLNMPTAGFYRIKGNTSGTYLASGLASNNKFNMSSATDASTIFYFSGDKLINYGSGLSNGMSSGAWAWVNEANASAVAFQDGQTNGGYAIQSATAFFYDNGDNATPSADRGGSNDGNARYNNWYLEEVTELPFTISAAGQATLALPTAWEVPTGVTVRYASTEHDGLLTVEDATATAVAANEAVILVGTPGDYTITLAASGETLGSILTSTGGGVSVPAETKAYILVLNGENQVVFGLLNDSERNIAGFKAYYISTAAGEAPAFLFFEDGTVTGINAVNAAAQNGAAVYDLQGRRVSNAQKGVYIVNGQKVLVK